ncbi:hypothetical protein AB0I81_17950 [Nonomuraea sp. NPDC050404]|uniref:hypothetical protein n=1 Tax=Nonomuraea sp. NPDC050404 TaxID=3155783 RepID=UPI0033C04441
MSKTAFDTAITQARDLLRWRSPLRTELWAARLGADLEASGQIKAFLRWAEEDGGQEARLALAALAAVNRPTGARAEQADERRGSDDTDWDGFPANDVLADDAAHAYAMAGDGVVESLPGWVRRMGQVRCDGAWAGKGDPYGEQVLAALSFRYENGKEPHVLVVGIDQPSGGLAVDALVEEAKFLDGLDLRPDDPVTVAHRILDAVELTDRVMGAQVADTLPAVRAFAITRARSTSGQEPADARSVSGQEPAGASHTGPASISLAEVGELPDLPGAKEAFGKLAEFVGDRPLWWSPARVSQFLTQWLPREAILSDEAIAAMPEVARAWTRHQGAHPVVLRQIDADAPGLPLLMADDSLASLNKRLARNR